MTEIERLEIRYRRLLRFDRGLCIVYATTALVPAYFLVTSSHARFFHASGVLAIASVAWFGWIVDTRLLRGRVKSEASAYCVTLAFILTRVAMLFAGSFVVSSQILGAVGSPMSLSIYWRGLLELLIAPPVTYLLFFVGFYRFIYHLSVHFLLRIEEMTKAANQ